MIWEPVLPIDFMAPSTRTLGRISDTRARQYWDKGRLLSKAMGETDGNSIVWDRILVYPRGTVWGEGPPAHLFADGTVVDVIPEFKAALTKALQEPAKL